MQARLKWRYSDPVATGSCAVSGQSLICLSHDLDVLRHGDDIGLNELAAQIQIRDNQLLVQGRVVASLANDLALKSIEAEVGFPGYRPILLTLPNGKGLMCSYQINSQGVEIAYPHTTSCHRGSGHIVLLKRPN